MKLGEITGREHRVKKKNDLAGANICWIWIIVMRQKRQSEEVLLNCGSVTNSGREHTTLSHDPDFCCPVISCFILKLCPHVSLFSPSLCVISLLPVFPVSFPHLLFSPPLSTCSSSPHQCVYNPCALLLSSSDRSCFPVLLSWCVFVLCSLCFLICTLLLFAALLLLLCVFAFVTHFMVS